MKLYGEIVRLYLLWRDVFCVSIKQFNSVQKRGAKITLCLSAKQLKL